MPQPLPPEHMRNSSIRALMTQHNREYMQSGIHVAYSAIIRLMLVSSCDYDAEFQSKVSRFADAEFAELPLLARFATNAEDGAGAFRITLGKVNPETLEDLKPSRLNIATIRGQREFSDIAQTFTKAQANLLAIHAFQITQIDGLIGRE